MLEREGSKIWKLWIWSFTGARVLTVLSSYFILPRHSAVNFGRSLFFKAIGDKFLGISVIIYKGLRSLGFSLFRMFSVDSWPNVNGIREKQWCGRLTVVFDYFWKRKQCFCTIDGITKNFNCLISSYFKSWLKWRIRIHSR